MVHGLMGSLTMMEKVLNDVLSFNRMESGKVCTPSRNRAEVVNSLLKLGNRLSSTNRFSSWL